MGEYKVDKIHYRNIYGKLLWTEKMIFKRLYAVNQSFITNSKEFIVKRVAVANNIQHVNIIEIQQANPPD